MYVYMDRRSLLALLATTTLAGCNGTAHSQHKADITAPTGRWTQFRGDPQRCGRTFQKYSFGPETEIHDTEQKSVTAPVLDGDTAIVLSGSSLVGLGLQTTTIKYEISLKGVPTLSPARCSSVVAVATDQHIAGYDMESRSQIWTLSAQGTYTAGTAPAALGDHFVVQDGNRVRLVERESGSVVWSREFDARLEGFAADENLLVVNRNTGEESEFIALNPSNGQTQWSVTTGPSRLNPVLGESIFALTEYGKLIAIEDGAVQWTVKTNAQNPEPMAVTDEMVVVISEPDSRCVGVTIGEESIAWKSGVNFANAVIANDDRAFVADANAGVIELDLATGERLRTFEDAKFADSLVPAKQGLLYTQSSNDRVFLLRKA